MALGIHQQDGTYQDIIRVFIQTENGPVECTPFIQTENGPVPLIIFRKITWEYGGWDNRTWDAAEPYFQKWNGPWSARRTWKDQ